MIVVVCCSGSVVVGIIAAAATVLGAWTMMVDCGHPNGLARPRFAIMGAPELIIVLDATYDGVIIMFVVVIVRVDIV
jgi:hypothetical protein